MTRRFDPTPLAPADLDALLDLARRAPSAGYSQGTHFLVLTGDALARFWKVSGCGKWFSMRQPGVLDAPAVIVPLADPHAYLERYRSADKVRPDPTAALDDPANWSVPFWLTDTSMAVQNLLLLAEEHGLGALYFGIFRNARTVLDEFGVPGHLEQVGAVALGHRAPDDRPSGSPTARSRRPLDEVVHHGRW